MDQRDFLMELEEALKRISDSLNAMELMVYGLESTHTPYAGGFYTVWYDLKEAEIQARKLLDTVSAAGASA